MYSFAKGERCAIRFDFVDWLIYAIHCRRLWGYQRKRLQPCAQGIVCRICRVCCLVVHAVPGLNPSLYSQKTWCSPGLNTRLYSQKTWCSVMWLLSCCSIYSSASVLSVENRLICRKLLGCVCVFPSSGVLLKNQDAVDAASCFLGSFRRHICEIWCGPAAILMDVVWISSFISSGVIPSIFWWAGVFRYRSAIRVPLSHWLGWMSFGENCSCSMLAKCPFSD